MGLLEQVVQMQNQGMTEDEIVSSMQEQGVPPKEINDALNQARVKSAVNEFSESPQENFYSPSQEQEQGQYQQNYYPQQQSYEEYSASASSNNVVEIAEQVFLEKAKPMQKQVEKFNEFQNISQVKLENIDTRLKKIEAIIDRLQISILEKIGSYGSSLDSIKKEMSMIEDSFAKVANKAIGKSHSEHEGKKK